MLSNVQTLVAIIGSIIGAIVALGTLWVNISKHLKEAHRERVEGLETQLKIIETLDKVTTEIENLKAQHILQQEAIERSHKVINSSFRMSLYRALYNALERGYTYVSEATEIGKLYRVYKDNGGNGEIEAMFNVYDKLEIKDDNFETR